MFVNVDLKSVLLNSSINSMDRSKSNPSPKSNSQEICSLSITSEAKNDCVHHSDIETDGLTSFQKEK